MQERWFFISSSEEYTELQYLWKICGRLSSLDYLKVLQFPQKNGYVFSFGQQHHTLVWHHGILVVLTSNSESKHECCVLIVKIQSM